MSKTHNKDFLQFIADEQSNLKSTWSLFPNEAKLTQEILGLYKDLNNNLNTYPRELTPVLQMYWICFRGFIVGTTLAFQIHYSESLAILSRCAEAVAIARKLQMHPNLVEKWIKKAESSSEPFRKLFAPLFPKEDRVLIPDILDIYNLSSDHGRHPNFQSTIFFSDFGKMKTENQVVFTFTDTNDITSVLRFISYNASSHIKFLKALTAIFNGYLAKEWLDEFKNVEEHFASMKPEWKKRLQAK